MLPSLLDEGLALRTLNCNLHIYKAFAQLLYEEDWITEPFGATIKPFKLQPSTAHTFPDQHLYQLLEQPDRTGLRNYVMMLTFLDTGIRLKELTNLHVTDVLLDEGSLRINHVLSATCLAFNCSTGYSHIDYIPLLGFRA